VCAAPSASINREILLEADRDSRNATISALLRGCLPSIVSFGGWKRSCHQPALSAIAETRSSSNSSSNGTMEGPRRDESFATVGS